MTTIIAEIGINHNGDVDIAKKLMLMAKECKCDGVKFQKRTVNAVYSHDELLKPRDSPWGKTQGDQKRGLELSLEEYREIDRYSRAIDIPWSASAWDIGSLEFLDQFNPEFHKIASPMITNQQFIEEVARRKKLTYISTGMLPNLCAVHKAANIFRYHDCPFVLMHCIGEYPCPPEISNLTMIRTLQQQFLGVPVGFSSHAVSPIIGAFAVLMGAVAIEAHITLDRSMYGSDQAASLEKPGLIRLVDYCRLAEQVRGDGIKRMTEKEIENAKKLRYFEHG